MSMRKATTLAGLALVLVALSPASALAKAGGTDRPVRGTVSGTVRANLQTLATTVEVTGVGSHWGKFTSSLEGSIAITPAGTSGSGTQTLVAANGDQLTGTYTLFTPGLPSEGHETTLVTTVTGGNGRFSGASGTVTSVSQITPVSVEGVTLVNSIEGSLRGRISY